VRVYEKDEDGEDDFDSAQEIKIGQLEGYKLQLYRGDLWDSMDGHSWELSLLYGDLLNEDGEMSLSKIETMPCNLLYISRLGIDEKWRGKNIGYIALKRLVDTLDIDNIVVKPHPMKYAVDKIDCNFEDLHGKDSADSEVNQAEKSIVDYYKRFGFQRIGRTKNIRQPSKNYGVQMPSNPIEAFLQAKENLYAYFGHTRAFS